MNTLTYKNPNKTEEWAAHNIGLAKVAAEVLLKNFVLNSPLEILMNFSVENQPHR